MDMKMRRDTGPYMGRRAFDAIDQDLFFGRDRECDELKALWETENTLVIMHGPAGSGKTSLLRAGLTAALPENAKSLPVGTISHRSPFPEAALPEHNPYTLAVLSSWSPAESRSRLARMSITEFITEHVLPSGWSTQPSLIIAAIDRFEEVLTDNAEAPHRDDLFDDLTRALGAVPQLRLLLSVRDEYLAAVKHYCQQMMSGGPAYISLAALDRDAAIEAVTRPLENVGALFAPGVAEELVDDLGARQLPSASAGPGSAESDRVEPVQLQVVCSRLYREMHFGTPVPGLSVSYIHSYVETSLADFCAEVVFEVAAEHEKDPAALADWLRRTFVTQRGTRRPVPEELPATAGMPHSLIRSLEDRHLLTGQWRSDARWFTLTNDRLISAVRRLNKPPSAGNVRYIDAPGHLQVAVKVLAEGEPELAEKHAWRALRSAATKDLRLRADARSLLGNIAFEQGRFDSAEEHYWHAAELNEQMSDQLAVGRLLGAIGRMQAKQGHHAAALQDLHSAVARMPGDLAMQTELGKALWRAGQVQAAAAMFGTVLAVEPEFAEALAGRGQIRAEVGDASSALDDLRTLQRLNPNMGVQPEIRSAYALALARADRLQAAMEEVDAALTAAPDNGLICLRAAKVASLSGATERAAALLDKAAEARSPQLSADQLTEARRLLASVSKLNA